MGPGTTASRVLPAATTVMLSLLAVVVATSGAINGTLDGGGSDNGNDNGIGSSSADPGTTGPPPPLAVSPVEGEGDGDDDDRMFSNPVELFNYIRPEAASVDKYVSLVIYCIGFPGNILAFAVWIQKRMRHSSGCYLAALALDDFIFLSLHVVFELHMVWEHSGLNTPVVCQLFPVLFLAAQYLGPLLVLGFTTERYISICHPFRREKYCTVRRARIVIAILVSSALGLSGAQGYFYTMQPTGPNGTFECGPRPEVRVCGGCVVGGWV